MLLDFRSLIEIALPPPPVIVMTGAPGVLRYARRALLPQLVRISPDTVKVLSPPFLLTVRGQHFAAASSVRLDGEMRATTFISQAELVTTVLPFDVRTRGTKRVDVVTPGIGASSNALPLYVVRNPARENEDLLRLLEVM